MLELHAVIQANFPRQPHPPFGHSCCHACRCPCCRGCSHPERGARGAIVRSRLNPGPSFPPCTATGCSPSPTPAALAGDAITEESSQQDECPAYGCASLHAGALRAAPGHKKQEALSALCVRQGNACACGRDAPFAVGPGLELYHLDRFHHKTQHFDSKTVPHGNSWKGWAPQRMHAVGSARLTAIPQQ